MHPKLITNS